MPEEQTDGEAWVYLYLVQTWFSDRHFAHAFRLLSSFLFLFLIWFPRPPRSPHALAEGRFKGCEKRDGTVTFPPFLPFHPHIPSFTPLSQRLKASRFQRKRLHTKGERGEEKKSSSFLCFSYKRQLSLTLPPPFTPLHPLSRCRIQIYRKIPHGTAPPPPLSSPPPNPTPPAHPGV